MKTSVRVVGLISVVTLSWAFMPSAATATFTSQDMGTYILWSQSSTNTYFQQYKADHSWKDSTSSSSGFNYMGKLGDLSTLLFDGSVHKFTDNNYSYQFWVSGTGVWQNASLNVNQYGFNYNTGQWYDQGNWGGWQTLGTTGLSTAFMGDSTSHTLGNNWSYLFDGTYGIWKNGNMFNVSQYAYNYTTGNWYDQGNWGGWATLGSNALSASFVGDTTSHTLGNNWSYLFDGTYGYWENAGMNLNQFAYNYTTGNWWDQGNWGGWQTLGSSYSPTGVKTTAALSASFVGDGAWHIMDANWNYNYVNGVGYWLTPALGVSVFSYDYNSGQWSDQGIYGGWQILGSTHLSSAFMGDGCPWSHNLGTGWCYIYSASDHTAETISNDNHILFKYDYTAGQWYHETGADSIIHWYQLGSPNLSAAFVGDGNWHDVGNNWFYSLTYSTETGYWKDGSTVRFSFQYWGYGWSDWSAYNPGGWSNNTNGADLPGSAQFIGDGTSRSSGYWNGVPVSFRYDRGANPTAYYYCNVGPNPHIRYDYSSGQWYSSPDGNTWTAKGSSGQVSEFDYYMTYLR